jgi:hypothetical protein
LAGRTMRLGEADRSVIVLTKGWRSEDRRYKCVARWI